MKKITKIALALLTSFSVSFSAFAGELSVTGSAKASYAIGGASRDAGKGLGVSNEFKLGAAGELDNGMGWNYSVAFDPSATSGTTNNDDQSLTVNMNSFGTAGIFITTGGLSTELKHGVGANGTGSDFASTMTMKYGDDVSNYHNVQYHLPADLLPFGIGAKVGYAPNLANTTASAADFKSAGTQNAKELGADATHYQLTASPVDGLSIAADYFETSGAITSGQVPTSGNVAANYTVGAFTIGAQQGYYDVGLTAKVGATNYENETYGVQFALNDAISLSISEEKTMARTRANIVSGATSAVKTNVESSVQSIQVAYNVGGATLGLTRVESDNSDYTTAIDEEMTLITMIMAF
jgi:hypothetical protein